MHRFHPDRITDPDEIAELVRRYEAGETVASLAEGTGYTWAGMHAILKRAGVKKFRGRRGPSPKKITLDDPRVVEAFRLYDGGTAYVRAAKQVGIAPRTLQLRLIESGRDHQRYWKGKEAKAWKGGRQRDAAGYVRVHADDLTRPMATGRDCMVLEHRAVMAHSLNRPLTPHETVHHINGKRDDNRLENLQLRNGRHGKGTTYTCLDCGSHNVEAHKL